MYVGLRSMVWYEPKGSGRLQRTSACLRCCISIVVLVGLRTGEGEIRYPRHELGLFLIQSWNMDPGTHARVVLSSARYRMTTR